MKLVRVSDVTYRMIAEAAILPFRFTGEQQPDGSWLVPVENDTHERLQQHRLPGESDDEAIQRIIHRYRGQPPS